MHTKPEATFTLWLNKVFLAWSVGLSLGANRNFQQLVLHRACRDSTSSFSSEVSLWWQVGFVLQFVDFVGTSWSVLRCLFTVVAVFPDHWRWAIHGCTLYQDSDDYIIAFLWLFFPYKTGVSLFLLLGRMAIVLSPLPTSWRSAVLSPTRLLRVQCKAWIQTIWVWMLQTPLAVHYVHQVNKAGATTQSPNARRQMHDNPGWLAIVHCASWLPWEFRLILSASWLLGGELG